MLLSFLTSMRDEKGLNTAATTALQDDLEFVRTSIAVLREADADAINALWSRVQFLSRFFGGDYLPRDKYNEWVNLCESFKGEVLDAVVQVRKQDGQQ